MKKKPCSFHERQRPRMPLYYSTNKEQEFKEEFFNTKDNKNITQQKQEKKIIQKQFLYI